MEQSIKTWILLVLLAVTVLNCQKKSDSGVKAINEGDEKVIVEAYKQMLEKGEILGWDNEVGNIPPGGKSWTVKDEKDFDRWISLAKEFNTILSKWGIPTDCADATVSLRWIYAMTKGLALMFIEKKGGGKLEKHRSLSDAYKKDPVRFLRTWVNLDATSLLDVNSYEVDMWDAENHLGGNLEWTLGHVTQLALNDDESSIWAENLVVFESHTPPGYRNLRASPYINSEVDSLIGFRRYYAPVRVKDPKNPGEDDLVFSKKVSYCAHPKANYPSNIPSETGVESPYDDNWKKNLAETSPRNLFAKDENIQCDQLVEDSSAITAMAVDLSEQPVMSETNDPERGKSWFDCISSQGHFSDPGYITPFENIINTMRFLEMNDYKITPEQKENCAQNSDYNSSYTTRVSIIPMIEHFCQYLQDRVEITNIANTCINKNQSSLACQKRRQESNSAGYDHQFSTNSRDLKVEQKAELLHAFFQKSLANSPGLTPQGILGPEDTYYFCRIDFELGNNEKLPTEQAAPSQVKTCDSAFRSYNEPMPGGQVEGCPHKTYVDIPYDSTKLPEWFKKFINARDSRSQYNSSIWQRFGCDDKANTPFDPTCMFETDEGVY